MSLQFAAYVGKGNFVNAAIRRVTGSKVSHCEWVVNGVAYSSSARDGGVRDKTIDFNDGNWFLVDVAGMEDLFSAGDILQHYAATKDDAYGTAELLLSQVLPFNVDLEGQGFCSNWCASAAHLPNAVKLSPGALLHWVVYLKEQFTGIATPLPKGY